VRRFWPFLLFAVIAVVHVVVLLVGGDSLASKAALMPVLLFAVMLVCGFIARETLSTGRGIAGMILLELAILVAWLTDIIFDRFGDASLRDAAGIVASSVTLAIFIALFAGPVRGRWRWWAAAPYVVASGGFLAFMVPRMGVFAPLVIVYALIVSALAFLATGAGGVAAAGGTAFYVSAILKGLRLFAPDTVAAVPAHVLDATIMAFYCAGLGLLALGATRRLVALGAEAALVRRKTATAPLWRIMPSMGHSRMR